MWKVECVTMQRKLSEYAVFEYENGDANPVRIAARAATADGHEFGDAGEVHLSDAEARELQSSLNAIYG